jgi:hypothetical protein
MQSQVLPTLHLITCPVQKCCTTHTVERKIQVWGYFLPLVLMGKLSQRPSLCKF